jgi:hypothetical protein
MSASEPTKDLSKTRSAVWLPIIITASVAIGSSAAWIYEKYDQHQKQVNAQSEELRATNERLLRDYLLPIQVDLQDTKSISTQLRDQCEPGQGILESYVIKVRRDGNEKNVIMFGLMTDLVGKNAEIVSLLEGYAKNGNALTDDFITQSAAFREHARTYGVRFKALPAYIGIGGQLPNWEPFPQQFPDALNHEIAERTKLAHPSDKQP